MTKIIHKTLRQEVADAIRERILNGEFKEGERLIEQDIAAMLGVSRGPVREALRQIEQEGMVEYTSHIGCSVRGLSDEEIYEIYMLRANLEMLAVHICKGNFSDSTIQWLEKYLEEMEQLPKNGTLEKCIDLDRLFHRTIVSQAGISRLLRLWETMDGDCALIFYKSSNTEEEVFNRQSRIHLPLLEAIKSRDEYRICSSLKEHYLLTTRRRLQEQGHSIEDFRYNIQL